MFKNVSSFSKGAYKRTRTLMSIYVSTDAVNNGLGHRRLRAGKGVCCFKAGPNRGLAASQSSCVDFRRRDSLSLMGVFQRVTALNTECLSERRIEVAAFSTDYALWRFRTCFRYDEARARTHK